MKQTVIPILFLILVYSCNTNQSSTTSTTTKHADTVIAAPTPAIPVTNDIPATGETTQQFVPQGYFVQYEAAGDINNDQLEDVAIVLRELNDSTTARALVVLLQQADGPKYKLADVGWNAIASQCSENGYTKWGTEDLEITNSDISLKLYDPGVYSNIFSTYRYMNGNIRLVILETFSQGAGGAVGVTHNLLTGEVKTEEINRMKDPEESTESTSNVKPQTVLLKDSDPDKIIAVTP